MCSAPLVRRGLIRLNAGRSPSRFNRSFFVVQTSLIIVAALAVGSTFAAGVLQGSSFRRIHEAYTGLQALFSQAKETGDMSVMASAGTYAAMFGKSARFAIMTNVDFTEC